MSETPHPPTNTHEKSDAHARPIAVFEIGLLAWVVISAALMAGLFFYFTDRAAELDVDSSPLADTREPAPGPQLQADPTTDIETLRAGEEERLNGFGWIDRAQGIARIPIDRAIDIVAERGLPTRPEAEVSE